MPCCGFAQFFKPAEEVTKDEAVAGLRDTLLAESRLGAGRHEHEHEHHETASTGTGTATRADSPMRDAAGRALTMQSYEFEPIGKGCRTSASSRTSESTLMMDTGTMSTMRVDDPGAGAESSYR